MIDMTFEDYMGEPFKMWVNGIDLSDYFYVIDVKGRSLSPSEINFMEIANKHGSYLINKRDYATPLTVKIMLIEKNIADLRKTIDELNGILNTNEEVPIVFSDEPDKTYFGTLSEVSEIKEVKGTHIATISFWRSSSNKYGDEHTYIITNGQDIFDVDNPGTADAEPKFKITLNEDVTFLSVVRDDSFMMVGKPLDEVNETPKQELEVILEDNMTTTSGWTSANTFVENGDVAGAFSSNGSYFYASNFGSGSLWHGPAMKKSLSESLQDFQVEFIVQFLSNGDPSKMGRIELVLLDTNNQTVGKLAMKDLYQTYAENQVEFRSGNISTGTRLIDGGPSRKDDWDDFYGILRFSRTGNIWRAYVAVIDSNGKFVKSRSETFTDYQNQYMAPITQVMIHVAQRGTVTPADMRIHKVKVFKRNSLQDNEIPIIGRAGDVFEFDCEQAKIFKNGEIVEFDLSSDFFLLKPGINRLAFYPSITGQREVTFRERYK